MTSASLETLTFTVNGKQHSLQVDPAQPLLWVIREMLGLTGTKFGCGIAQCGACTLHLNGQPIRSCVTPVAKAQGASITTIEGIAADAELGLHPVQQAWIEEQVPQCGYCQSGQIMSAVALLADNPQPSDADIDSAMAGNLCRCGMYARIRRAVHTAAEASQQTHKQVRIHEKEEVSRG
jgi:isoquinoline 1-oxidoreductase alpha subunit